MAFADRMIDPDNGWTVWDYARGIYNEMCNLREQAGTDPSPPITRLRRPFVILTDASGNGQVELALNPGVQWNLLTCAFTIPFAGTPTGYVAFYRDVEEGTGLIKVVPAAEVVDESFNAEGHLIPEQSKLLVVARGVLPNAGVSGNVTAKSIANAIPRTTRTGG